MKTSVTGFPRIGKLRELKFAEEKYFRKEISEEDLFKVASVLKKEHWEYMRDAGIDLIPSNDFSFYDNILDTAFMLNVIPKRYSDLREHAGITDTDVYLAMSRGYQGKAGDVPALAMKKWFNTNYHYIVPEFEDDANVTVRENKALDEFNEALSCGIKTKPCITGPFTFLKLAKGTGKKSSFDFADDVVDCYAQIISELRNAGAEWVQLDEPSLVCDITEDEKEIFLKVYEKIVSGKDGIKILINTYFGDVRDCYQELVSLDVDGIGLDLIEGKKTLELIKTFGFPKDKQLFAGLINGKNVRKCNYKNTLDTLARIKEYAGEVVLSTACSLLHVPYTLKYEDNIPDDIKNSFSFALEKLNELHEVSELAEKKDPETEPAYVKNGISFEESSDGNIQEVRAAVEALTEKDFTRLPERKEREGIQREILGLPSLPTTTIGSFPQTAEVKANRGAYRKGEITKEEYDKNIYAFIKDCIKLQEDTGLDVLVHGEYERNDMVEFFGENLEGFTFTQKAWVQSYGTRCVKPPVITGDVRRRGNITKDYIRYAQDQTDKPVKGMLTGPVTILNWSFPREDIHLRESAYQIALAIRQEAEELEASGIRIIQIDEAALREKLPLRKEDRYSEYLDWAIKAFRLCHSGLKPETQVHTHMCYSEFSDIIKDIDEMDADVISFEASRSDLKILESLRDNDFQTQVGPGVYDIHSPRVPSVEEIKIALGRILEKTDRNKAWVNPDCGLKTRGIEETVKSLKNLVKAACEMR